MVPSLPHTGTFCYILQKFRMGVGVGGMEMQINAKQTGRFYDEKSSEGQWLCGLYNMKHT